MEVIKFCIKEFLKEAELREVNVNSVPVECKDLVDSFLQPQETKNTIQKMKLSRDNDKFEDNGLNQHQ